MITYDRFLVAALVAVFTSVGCGQQSYRYTETQAASTVKKVLAAAPIIDGHNDLFAWYHGCEYKKLKKCPQDIDDYPIDVVQKGHTDIPRWRKGGVGGVHLNVYGESLPLYLDAFDLLSRLEKRYAKDLEVVRTSAQMRRVMRARKIALLPMLEGSIRLENKTSLLRVFYSLGLRTVTFTYNTSELGDGSDDEPKHNGISPIGREMVREMNRLGIIVDLSHASAKAMSNVLDVTSAPVVFTHSNARAICDVNRNVPDDILLRLKKNRGLIMIDVAPEHTSTAFARWMEAGDKLYFSTKKEHPGDAQLLKTVMDRWESDNPKPHVSIGEVADHFDHVRSLIGVEHIGISGDFDGIEFTIAGLEDVSSFPKLLVELARRGWTEKELRKITSENFIRVFGEVERAADKNRD